MPFILFINRLFIFIRKTTGVDYYLSCLTDVCFLANM